MERRLGAALLPRMAKKVRTLRTWRIYRIRGTPAQFIGSVQAPDEKSALKEAIKEFNITDAEQQKRLIALREG